jgi:hypothetical protein
MVLNIHSNASYMLEANACSHACGHFFMGWKPKDGELIGLNGAFILTSTIMQFAMASTSEAEQGALYHNCQTGIIFQLTLAGIGHPQQKMLVHCNNTTVIGIANNFVKRQHLHSMEMHFFWVGD